MRAAHSALVDEWWLHRVNELIEQESTGDRLLPKFICTVHNMFLLRCENEIFFEVFMFLKMNNQPIKIDI